MKRHTLVDAVDSLLNKGVSLVGESTISLADVDLVYLRLNLLLASAETLRRSAENGNGAAFLPSPNMTIPSPLEGPGRSEGAAELRAPSSRRFGHDPHADSDKVGVEEAEPPTSRSLAGLVLTLAEFLRQIVERQALRRVEGGGLRDEQVEELGLALARLELAIGEMREALGLEPEDLEIDLGPLGRLD